MRSEIQRLLIEIALLNRQHESSVASNENFKAGNSIKDSIKKLQEQLGKMQEKLLGVSIE
ncbi:MAG: hypothetical protein QM706_03360 [Nitrospira sp.]